MNTVIGLIIVILLTIVALFQFALAAGLQQGDMVFGGRFPKMLPKKMRIISCMTGFTLLLIAFFYAMKSGLVQPFINESALNIIIIILSILMGLNTLGNIASQSNKERYIMTPITAIVFVGGLVLVVG